MSRTEVLRARVEPEFARAVEAWADAHGTDVSEAIRTGLRKLLEEEERQRRVEEALRELDELAEKGVFEPPKT